MSAVIIVFPGSNCDRDIFQVMSKVLNYPTQMCWHEEQELPSSTSLVILPGGFSYGDALRGGSLARLSPIMKNVQNFASQGGKVLGICNGFQILCEMGLLPGILLPNHTGRFVCKIVELDFFVNNETLPIQMPIAHGEGRYFASPQIIQGLFQAGQVALTYREKDADGRALCNGSESAIAGLYGGSKKTILGLMPHPERLSEQRLGGTDGLLLLERFLAS